MKEKTIKKVISSMDDDDNDNEILGLDTTKNKMKKALTNLHQNDKEDTMNGLPRNLPSYIRTDAVKKLSEARGLRVRMVRHIASMSLNDFSQSVGIEHGSMGRIERGSTCLSILKAKTISLNLYNQAGLLVSPKFLLSGSGKSILEMDIPKVDISRTLNDIIQKKTTLPEYLTQYFAISYVYKEIYKQQKPIIMFVNDSSMDLIYKKGDMVGGIIKDKNIEGYFKGQPCIVRFKNNQPPLVRFVHKAHHDYMILTNTNHATQPLSVSMSDIESIYEINFSQKTSLPNDHLISEEENLIDVLDINDIVEDEDMEYDQIEVI